MLSSAEPRNSALHIRNILVPTDFSPASERALQLGQMLAYGYGADLHVVHVVASEAYPLKPPKGVATVHDIGRARAAANLEKIRLANSRLGITHDEVVREGETWSELSAMISGQEVDLIIVGTHGAGGVEKLVLGSVAEEVLRKALCPVITVGPHVTPEAINRDTFREIVLPIDFSAQARAALPLAVSLASQTRSHLTLLYVADELAVPDPYSRTIVSEAFTQRLLELVPEGTPHPSTRVDFGRPAEIIVQTAAALGSGLIVLGVREAGEFSTHLPWAVASQVVRNASCPVLTIRSKVQEK